SGSRGRLRALWQLRGRSHRRERCRSWTSTTPGNRTERRRREPPPRVRTTRDLGRQIARSLLVQRPFEECKQDAPVSRDGVTAIEVFEIRSSDIGDVEQHVIESPKVAFVVDIE